jgi:hypothetical protein
MTRKNLIMTLLLIPLIVPELNSQELFCSNDHFRFYRHDSKDYEPYLSAFTDAYEDLTSLFELEKDHSLDVIIFSGQQDFIREVYGYYEPKVTSVGMASPGKNKIYITSFHDTTTGRDFAEYMQVARHELVHVLMKNEKAWLSEGLALWCAGQTREFESLPSTPGEMYEYLECNIYNREAYAYYAWFTRFLIQKAGFQRYLLFYNSDNDWSIIGYPGQKAFCNDAFSALQQHYSLPLETGTAGKYPD